VIPLRHYYNFSQLPMQHHQHFYYWRCYYCYHAASHCANLQPNVLHMTKSAYSDD
jgi:hypothetical protein